MVSSIPFWKIFSIQLPEHTAKHTKTHSKPIFTRSMNRHQEKNTSTHIAVRSRAILRIWAIRFEWFSFWCFFSVPAHVRNCQHLPSTDAVCDFHPGVLHVCHDHIGWCGSNSGWAIDVGLHRLCSWSSILWYDSREQLKKAEEVRILILDDFGFPCKTDRKHVHNCCIYNYIQIYIYIYSWCWGFCLLWSNHCSLLVTIVYCLFKGALSSAALYCIGFEEICFDFKITTPSGQPEQTSDIISFEI